MAIERVVLLNQLEWYRGISLVSVIGDGVFDSIDFMAKGNSLRRYEPTTYRKKEVIIMQKIMVLDTTLGTANRFPARN